MPRTRRGPPRNRTPRRDEVDACAPFLEGQLRAIRPQVICALGGPAAQKLLRTTKPIGRLRGRFHQLGEYQVMPTYHPAHLLRHPEAKRKVWQDVQMIMQVLARGRSAGS